MLAARTGCERTGFTAAAVGLPATFAFCCVTCFAGAERATFAATFFAAVFTGAFLAGAFLAGARGAAFAFGATVFAAGFATGCFAFAVVLAALFAGEGCTVFAAFVAFVGFALLVTGTAAAFATGAAFTATAGTAALLRAFDDAARGGADIACCGAAGRAATDVRWGARDGDF